MSSTRRASAPPPQPEAAAVPAVRTLKKYPNRRLYDTRTSSYLALADVKKMVLGGEDFEVRDAKTGEDLTRSILLQIILEEESGGVPMFSTPVLAQIIRFYGNAMQGMMGSYLEKNIHTFIEMQKRLQDQSRQVYGENPMLNSDAWNEFIKMQGPAMQGLMGSYLEQSANAFMEMQQNLQKQTRNLFGNFPFPNFTGGTPRQTGDAKSPGSPAHDSKNEGSEGKS